MAKAGDSYVVELKQAHLEWGEHRYTNSRGIVYGEGYIAIPAEYAYDFDLRNKYGAGQKDVFGKNLFNCESADGLFKGVLRAQGNQGDERFAKQFSGDNDLKAIGSWYSQIDAQVGDRVKVTWLSPTDIKIEKL